MSARQAVHLEEETPENRQEIGQSMHTSTKVCIFTTLDTVYLYATSSILCQHIGNR